MTAKKVSTTIYKPMDSRDAPAIHAHDRCWAAVTDRATGQQRQCSRIVHNGFYVGGQWLCPQHAYRPHHLGTISETDASYDDYLMEWTTLYGDADTGIVESELSELHGYTVARMDAEEYAGKLEEYLKATDDYLYLVYESDTPCPAEDEWAALLLLMVLDAEFLLPRRAYRGNGNGKHNNGAIGGGWR